MHEKIKQLSDIGIIVDTQRKEKRSIIHCHGVFDLLHPGHIHHLKEAKQLGDLLVVSITPDKFVNKGPGRPVFDEKLRLEQIASLACVDFAILNSTPDAISAINAIKPDIYVKGGEYQNHTEDITGKISDEARAVETWGGKVHYTDGIVFSSSNLLNRFFDSDAKRIAPFIKQLKQHHSIDEIIKKIDAFSKLKVLVIGDAIIDEYQYANPLGQSGKGVHLTASLLEKEVYLGGSLIIANHLSTFAEEVTLLCGVGRHCPHLPFIQSQLDQNVKKEFVYYDDYPTLTKRRYVLKDGKTITKLFETYSSNCTLLEKGQTDHVIDFLQKKGNEYDAILVCDFGNGFTNPAMIAALSQAPAFLAVNTQTNSGNRGYNVVTHYHRADFVSLNEPEIRLAAHDRYSRIDSVVQDIGEILKCTNILITRGVNGIYIHPSLHIPALTMNVVDRVGAGDSCFALAALSAAKGYSPLLLGFLGSAAAAIDVQIIGNKEAINKTELCKYITRLMK